MYIKNISKLNLQITRESKSQLDNFCHKVKQLVPGMGYIYVTGSLIDYPKQFRLCLRVLVTLHNRVADKPLLLKITVPYITKCRKVELMPYYSLHTF